MATAPVSQAQLENASAPPLSPAEIALAVTPANDWTPARARAIAVGDFEQMSNFRQSSGHNMRLQIAEELYLGWQPKKYWGGKDSKLLFGRPGCSGSD